MHTNIPVNKQQKILQNRLNKNMNMQSKQEINTINASNKQQPDKVTK